MIIKMIKFNNENEEVILEVVSHGELNTLLQLNEFDEQLSDSSFT